MSATITSWWDETFVFDGVRRTPNDYIKDVYASETNTHIASVLARVTNRDVSTNAVKKRARRLGLRKDQTALPAQTLGAGASIEEDGNNLTVSAVVNTGIINTLDDLLRFCNVDLETWYVVRHRITAWQMGAKVETKDLVYTEGAASGTVKADGIQKEQLVKIEVVLERKTRIATFPDIVPCRFEAQIKGVPQPKKVKVALQWSDPHFGYKWDMHKLVPLHHRPTLQLLEKVLQSFAFDEIHLLGDVFDFAEYSTHFVQSPEFSRTAQPAILEAHWILQRQRKLQPSARMVAFQGNHDKRPEDAIKQYVEASYQLRGVKDFELPYSTYSIANLLDLQGLGIEWVENYPDGEDWIGNIRLSHGVLLGSKPGDTVKKLSVSEDSEVQGHGHRMEAAIITKNYNRRQKVQLSAMTGCACFTDGRVPGHSPHLQQWQNGFSVIEYSDTEFNITFVPVVNNKCIYNGLLFVADEQDYMRQLKQDVPMFSW